ncbi:hypothetical protein GGQ19_003098 [Salinibacter ruber]|uniref:hypothetical protein n=1 Tax=Salinibacter ruber TaxID=146919 RepID=UPI002169EC01|nr:hypothetical protein [Salinibacter ruber]MCS3751901.1 hypothetical protein [Salinibacter ruber]
MGQQQLLLLALSAVIVGLSVVAGIEAFGEGQRQATQDALAQRAVSIGTDIVVAHKKPSQLGGIDVSHPYPSDEAIASVVAPESSGRYGSGILAIGAGETATCDIDHSDGGTVVYVDCGSEQTGQGYPDGQIVKAKVEPGAEDPVKVVDTDADGHSN